MVWEAGNEEMASYYINMFLNSQFLIFKILCPIGLFGQILGIGSFFFCFLYVANLSVIQLPRRSGKLGEGSECGLPFPYCTCCSILELTLSGSMIAVLYKFFPGSSTVVQHTHNFISVSTH